VKNYCLTKLQKLRNATKLIFSFLILLFTLIFLQTNAYAVTRAVTGKALVMSTGNSYLDFTSYGSNVTVDNTTGDFTGYAFLEDVGWVDFGTVDNPDGPVNLDFDTEAVTGKAYVLNTGAYIDFTAYNSNVEVSVPAGVFSGYGFSEDIGWLNFSDTGVSTTNPFDLVAPTIILTAITPDPGNDNTPTLTGTATEETGTVAGVQYQVDSIVGPWTACTANDTAFDEAIEDFSCTPTALVDGAHTIYVRATDSNANTTAPGSESSDAFTIDATASTGPTNVTSSDHTTSTWSSDSTITMTWTAATDGGEGLLGYSYIFDTSATTTPDTTQDIGLVTTITSGNLTDGISHYFHIRAVDGVGNWGTAVHAGPYYIDSTSPSGFDLKSPEDDEYTNDKTPIFKWEMSSDASSGLNKYQVIVDDEVLIDDINPTDPGDSEGNIREDDSKWVKYNDTTIEAHTKGDEYKLKSGTREWKVRVFDNAGNRKTTGSWSLIVDTKSPNLTLDEISGNKNLDYTSNSSPTMFTTTDTTPTFKGTSEEGAKVTVNGGSDTLCSSTLKSESWDCTSKKTLSYGNTKIKITSEDRAGNITILPEFTLLVSKDIVSLSFDAGNGVTEVNKDKDAEQTPSKEAVISPIVNPATLDADMVHTLNLKLIDEEKKPMAGVTVMLFSDPKEAVTNSEGIATFNDVEKGEHKIVINDKNFSGEKKIVINGDTVVVDLTIQVKATNPFTSPVVMVVIGILLSLLIASVVIILKLRLKTVNR